jgi:putative nucleotidyltransferase with HDIG domain
MGEGMMTTKADAIRLFDDFWQKTPSTPGFDRDAWRGHSLHTAEAAALIAHQLDGVCPEKAYACGLLHDLGKAVDPAPKRHSVAGYRLLSAMGCAEAARVALTHDFPDADLDLLRQEGFLDEAEIAFVGPLLAGLDYDIYDRLIQVCDVISLPDGYVLMEKRMLRAVLRYGQLTESLKRIMAASDENIHYLEARLGRSIYAVLPGVVENTFGAGFRVDSS